MRRNFFAALIFVSLIATSIAAPVTPEMALNAAQTYLELHAEYLQNPKNRASAAIGVSYELGHINPLIDPHDGAVLGYIANLDPVGYIAIGGNTKIRPVIVHSFKSDFSFEETPMNHMLHMLRGDLNLRFEALSKTSRDILAANSAEWDNLITGGEELTPLYSSMVVYGPWLDTNWGQGHPYNTRCPVDPETGYRCVTGCTATAMAMIHNYWEYPPFVAFAEDESYYSGYTDPAIFIDAPTANDDSLEYNYAGTGDPSNSELANLMWASGVSVGAWYSSGGTGASVSASYYINKWGYNEDAVQLSGDHSEFYDYLSTDMMEGRPAQLSIYQSDWTGGHSINCDGYNSTTDRYHLNMGWEGSSNGWYSLPEGMPVGYSIITNAVMNLQPDPRPDAPDICSEAMSIEITAEAGRYKDAIYRPGEEDWFTFEAIPESSYIFYTRGSTNTFGAIYDVCGGELVDSSSTGISRGNFFLQFIPDEAGTYKLLIRGIDAWEFGLYSLYYRTGEGPSIEFMLPASGTVLTEGENQVIQWVSGGVPDFTLCQLDYSLEGPDGPWQTITDSTDITFFIWEVPYVTEEENDVYIRVGSVVFNSIFEVIGPFTILDVTGIGENSSRPDKMTIRTYPNPFNSAMAIDAPVGSEIAIYDIRGRSVEELGNTSIWRPSSDVQSGLYLVVIRHGNEKTVLRAMYLK